MRATRRSIRVEEEQACVVALFRRDGIVLSMERLDRIIEVDKDNMMIVAEAGVTLQRLLKEVENAGLLFPRIPATRARRLAVLLPATRAGPVR